MLSDDAHEARIELGNWFLTMLDELDEDEVNDPAVGRTDAFAWLHNRRRLLVRTDRRDDIHESLLALACCLICWRRLETSFD